MGTDLPKVIWESEHKGGTRFRIVRCVKDASSSARPGPDFSIEHRFEGSGTDDVDAMGVRTWWKAGPSDVALETLLAALLRELPS